MRRELVVPFELRGYRGRVDVRVVPNDDPGPPDGDWLADTFLVAIPDVLRSRRLSPIAAFSWGYRLIAGTPELLELSRRDPADWSGHRVFLSEQCPDWEFL